jgi:hypothetical protein
MLIKYAPNAPKELIELHDFTTGQGTVDGAYFIYPEKLLSLIEDSKKNNCLWGKLKPFIENNDNFRDNDDTCLSLYNTIESALAGLFFWEDYTKRERKDRCNDIANKARELANLLKRTPFDYSLLTELDQPSYYDFTLEQFPETQKDYLKSLMNDGYIAKMVDEEVARGEITNKHQKILYGMGLEAPSFSDALFSLALKADNRTKNFNEIINKKSDSSQQVYFIRRVSDWFYCYCDNPLQTYTATIADIVFAEPSGVGVIGLQEVRDALRNYTPRKPVKTTAALEKVKIIKNINQE